MKIHKGDNVQVISGKDKGKKGKVLRAFPKTEKVLVEGVNIRKKHQRASKNNPSGQIIEKTMPIHVSNVMAIDPKSGKPTRVGRQKASDGKKTVRVAKRSGTVL